MTRDVIVDLFYMLTIAAEKKKARLIISTIDIFNTKQR